MATAQPEEQVTTVRARAKYVRTSARKARLVCEHIRGKTVEEARAVLAFTPRAAARDWSKLLESAVANAEHNHELVGDDLRIKEAYADEGPTLKRFRARAMGRATRIRKRTAHLTISLAPIGTIAPRRDAPPAEEPPKPPEKQAPASKPKGEEKPSATETKATAKPAAKKPAAEAEKKPKRAPRRRKKTEKDEEGAE
jgi:ribosomal protein L22